MWPLCCSSMEKMSCPSGKCYLVALFVSLARDFVIQLVFLSQSLDHRCSHHLLVMVIKQNMHLLSYQEGCPYMSVTYRVAASKSLLRFSAPIDMTNQSDSLNQRSTEQCNNQLSDLWCRNHKILRHVKAPQ